MLSILAWLPGLPTGLYLAGALACAAMTSGRGWAVLAAVTRSVLAVAILQTGWALSAPRFPAYAAPDLAAALVTLLVAFLGWIIGDFSRRYLNGEPGQTRFLTAFLATLGAISAVVASQNLALLIAAWAAASLGLHHLLTFYPERQAAIVVAHKKFLTSRLAEALLIVAAALLYTEWGSLDLTVIATQATALPSLPATAHVAAVLIALAVLLKCAQLPLHGWLIQVMEAPTPVSALLHAGVVNLGGYVLIRLAPLISASTPARSVLVIVGSLTAVLAGLVMLTRITIKVRLAWSTCSQMGLMILECGLGLYDLALLHLVAHALYKAHAFLTSGDAVRASLQRDLLANRSRTSTAAGISILALAAAVLVISLSSALWSTGLGLPPLPALHTLLLAFGLATLFWAMPRKLGGALWTLGTALAATQLYLGWHALSAGFLPALGVAAHPALQAWALLTFLALYGLQTWLFQPRGSIPKALYEWIYAGLYLDERFTRLTFRLWPPSVPTPAPEHKRSLS